MGDTLAVVAVGIIWGVWHAPLLLLGYNYSSLAPGWRLVWMSVFCLQLTAVLAWVRQRSRSVWPAAIGHGTLNAGLAVTALLLGAPPDLRTASASLMGWAGLARRAPPRLAALAPRVASVASLAGEGSSARRALRPVCGKARQVLASGSPGGA